MTSMSKLAVAALLGSAVSGLAAYGLQAQSKKAYTVTELQILDAKLTAEVAPKIAAARAKAGGHNLKTGGGKITSMEGTAPDRVAITEWQSLAKAQDFFKSKAFTDLAPEREKALKTIRRYAVEER